MREVVHCQLHPEKEIEYFCKQCEESVCSRCIFKNHNGHLLVETTDIGKNIILMNSRCFE